MIGSIELATLMYQLYDDIAYTYRYIINEQKDLDIIVKGLWGEEIKEKSIREHELFTGSIDPINNVKGKNIKTTIYVYKDQLQFYRIYYKHGEGKYQMVEFIEKRKNGNNHLRSNDVQASTFNGMKCVDTLTFNTTSHQDIVQSDICMNLYPTCTIDIIRKGRIVGKHLNIRKARIDPPIMFIKHELWYNSYHINALLGVQYNKQNNESMKDNDLKYTIEFIQQIHERECIKAEKLIMDTKVTEKKEENKQLQRKNFSTTVKIQTLNRQECRDCILDFVLKDGVLLLEYDHKNGQPYINTQDNCQALSVITHSIKTYCQDVFKNIESSEEERVKFIINLLNCITRSKIFVENLLNGKIQIRPSQQSAEMIQNGIFYHI